MRARHSLTLPLFSNVFERSLKKLLFHDPTFRHAILVSSSWVIDVTILVKGVYYFTIIILIFCYLV